MNNSENVDPFAKGGGEPALLVAPTTPMWHRPRPFTLAMGTAMNGHIRQLNKEMNSFVTEDFVLKTVDNKTVGYEGVSMAKMGSWYVVAAAEWNGDMRYQGSYDLMYAISKNILGPYTKRRFGIPTPGIVRFSRTGQAVGRSEEHTSELQSLRHL